MANPQTTTRLAAETDYAAAVARLALSSQPAPLTVADPYGRAFLLSGGDYVVAPGADGLMDLASVSGKEELAQGIQILVGTPLGSDLFNRNFGFDLINTLAQPRPLAQMRELVRLCVVKALSQEPRIRQLAAVAFTDETAYRAIHPELTDADISALKSQQSSTRKWSIDVLLDTRFNDQLVAQLQGVGL